MSRIVFITGGVVSSLGKGIIAASLGTILKAHGFKVKLRKLDPYLNVDPGTMNPVQHGEVFVTKDGGETDLDLGYYERFTGVESSKEDNITSGKIYQNLIQKERRGDYIGQTVQVVPHVTSLIKDFILNKIEDYDFIICEIGGTVGDIEGQPFLETIRQLRYELGKNKTISIHVTLLPYIAPSDEVKTKPTQHSVKELMSYGISADMLMCRTNIKLSSSDRYKLSSFCNIEEKNLIEAPDVKNVYELPIIYSENALGERVLQHFGMNWNYDLFDKNIAIWKKFVERMNEAKKENKIAIVGKYIASKDAYKSLLESIRIAATYLDLKAEIDLIDAKGIFSYDDAKEKLESYNSIIVAGGFGSDGVTGKIESIKYARENNIPFLGICFGMQLAVIEFMRNVCGIKDATSTEFSQTLDGFQIGTKVVDLMEAWIGKDNKVVDRSKCNDLGGTMRLGEYIGIIKKNTLAEKIYKSDKLSERHRHRYEVDINLSEVINKFGGDFSCVSPDGKLPEIFEIKNHKFFISTQFHPEFLSSPIKPHPLFVELIKAGIK